MNNRFNLIGILLVSSFLLAVHPPETDHQSLEKTVFNLEQTIQNGHWRIGVDSDLVRAGYMLAYEVPNGSPLATARTFLSDYASDLGIRNDLADINLTAERETPGGYRLRFTQVTAGYPVYRSDIVVSINHKNQVVMLQNGYQPLPRNFQPELRIPEQAAFDLARQYLELSGQPDALRSSLEILVVDENPALVYNIFLRSFERQLGEWEVLVDAGNGNILQARNITINETGYGYVFDPDPVTRSQSQYGNGGLEDNNDNDHPDLTAQLVDVELNDLFMNGGQYTLESPYASIVDVEGPWLGDFSQTSSDFHATRSQNLFEAVNVFHHIDHSMRYINDTLNFNVWPFMYGGGVQFDPHGLNGDLNAHYSWDGYVAFGTPSGSVDLGEDHAVVLHELGHGIHHWITDGGLSQEDGLSEGCADFWAQSYTRSLGFFEPGDTQYDWFSIWGFNPYLRVTNFSGHYPESLNGSVHHDGQLWSSSLMSIYDEIGKTATDRIFWEGMSSTGGNSDQMDAAWAVMQADLDLYDGEHLPVVGTVFLDRGYIDEPLVADFGADQTGLEPGMTVQFSDLSISVLGPVISWEWDLDGDGVTDSTDPEPTWTYNMPGLYTVSMTISDGYDTITETKVDFVSVNFGIFVWEGPEGGVGFSGQYIFDYLSGIGLAPVLSRAEGLPSSLMGYDAVFMSLGNTGDNNITRLTNPLAEILQDYLENGGSVYLEGGEPLGWDQRDNSELHQLFSLDDAEDGESDPNYIDYLEGLAGSLADGMLFTGSDQQNANYIDTFIPNAQGISVFAESGYGTVAAQGIGDYNQRTFCFSYALAQLQDGDHPSTRENLMVQLVNFFLLDPGVMGDVNGDNELNVLDIVTMVNIIIHTVEPTGYQLVVSDMNHDGSINVLDIITLLNVIIG